MVLQIGNQHSILSGSILNLHFLKDLEVFFGEFEVGAV